MKPSVYILLAATLFGGLGCASLTSGRPEINPGIAAHYAEFYQKGTSDRAAASRALQSAESADPQNGYTHYLRASLQASQGDLKGALESMEKGNGLPHVRVYVEAPPPIDNMPSLTRVRQLGATSAKAIELGADAPRYLAAVQTMGERVAAAEPVSTFTVFNGAGVVRRGLQSEIDYWTAKKDDAKAAEAEARLTSFRKWYDGLNDAVRDTLTNLMREAGKAAGLTEAEMMSYAKGQKLADGGKQRKADEARSKQFDREIEALREQLKKMPRLATQARG